MYMNIYGINILLILSITVTRYLPINTLKGQEYLDRVAQNDASVLYIYIAYIL